MVARFAEVIERDAILVAEARLKLATALIPTKLRWRTYSLGGGRVGHFLALCLAAVPMLLPNLAGGVANEFDRLGQLRATHFLLLFLDCAAVFRALTYTRATLASYAILYIRRPVPLGRQSKPSVEQIDSESIFQALSAGCSQAPIAETFFRSRAAWGC